jgi:hypothetical protein
MCICKEKFFTKLSFLNFLVSEAKNVRERLAEWSRVGDGGFLSVASEYLEPIETAQHVKSNGVQPIKMADIRQNLLFILRGPL